MGYGGDEIKEILADRELRKHAGRIKKIDNGHDLPYLAGISKDGEILYIDRHVPEKIELKTSGKTISFDPRRFLGYHESWEQAEMDRGMKYQQAHRVGTGVERYYLTLQFGPEFWAPYQKYWGPFIKADEHEKLQNVPEDLEMRPYLAKPVDRALLKQMHTAQGNDDKNRLIRQRCPELYE